MPSFYARIGYDAALERDAFARLAALDLAGCRRALDRLVHRLVLPSDGLDGRRAMRLLEQILHRVNRELNPPDDRPAAFEAKRLQLLERLDGDPAVARERFLAALAGLLGPERSDGGNLLVPRARDLIDQQYRERLSLSRVATDLHVSPNHLSRLFRRETGMTLTAYIQRVRLIHARRLLAEGGRRISEVAYLVGYQNYRDFYRNFVKYERDSPRRARQRLAGHTEPETAL